MMKNLGAIILSAVLIFNLFGDFTGYLVHHISHTFQAESSDHFHDHMTHHHDEFGHQIHHSHANDHQHGAVVNFFMELIDFDQTSFPSQQNTMLSVLMMTIDGFVPNHHLQSISLTEHISVPNNQGFPSGILNLNIPTPPPRLLISRITHIS